LGVFGGAPGTNGGTIAFTSWPYGWAAVIQMIGGTLVALGVFTRPVALLCSGSMAYAYFTVNQKFGLLPVENNGDSAALFAWTFLLIAVLGPGSWALGSLFERRGITAQTTAGAQQEKRPSAV
jgi:putative oxidoreductase